MDSHINIAKAVLKKFSFRLHHGEFREEKDYFTMTVESSVPNEIIATKAANLIQKTTTLNLVDTRFYLEKADYPTAPIALFTFQFSSQDLPVIRTSLWYRQALMSAN